jgi:hypothetical protein
MEAKQRIYGERYPIDEELLQALAMMPPASAVALGLDRLVMLAAGATRIDQVLWTPLPERRKDRNNNNRRNAMLALYHATCRCARRRCGCASPRGLAWESRHLALRAGDHQQPWYLKLNRRAVVPTLIDGDR